MSNPKFSMGDSVVIVDFNQFACRLIDKGKIFRVIGVQSLDGMVRGANGACDCYYGYVYSLDNAGDYPEETLRPIPKEQPTTWESIEQLTGWSPVKEVV